MNNRNPEATITIPVDLYDPGEFLACCGLLELTHRLTPAGQRARGWFEETDAPYHRFLISAFNNDDPLTFEKTILPLMKCTITDKNPDSKEGPVLLGHPFNIILDWRSPFPQNGTIKTFAGQQDLFKIVTVLHKAVSDVKLDEISERTILSFRKPTEKEVTAFSVEKAENVLDSGFSMDIQKNRLFRRTRVFLEYLALIGAQRFCPQTGEDRLSRIYFAWRTPLTVHLAAIAASTFMGPLRQKGFISRMYERDMNGRYKGFASARAL